MGRRVGCRQDALQALKDKRKAENGTRDEDALGILHSGGAFFKPKCRYIGRKVVIRMEHSVCRKTLRASRIEGEHEARIYTCPKGGYAVTWGPLELDEAMLELLCEGCER